MSVYKMVQKYKHESNTTESLSTRNNEKSTWRLQYVKLKIEMKRENTID